MESADVRSWSFPACSGRLPLEVVDRKTFGVLFRFGRVKCDSVEECFRLVIQTAVGVTDLFHRFFVEVMAEYLADHSAVIRGPAHHAPAPELAEPPNPVLRLRVVAIALAENHVMLVLPASAVPVLEVP